MSSPVWKWCLAHYVIICDHVFAGLEVFLAHYVIICDHVFAGLEVFLAHYVIICDHVFAGLEVFLAHYVIICDHVFAGLEVFLAHYVIICDHVFTGLEVFLAHYVIICDHVFAGLEVFLAHYVIICDHVFAGLEVFLAHYVIICDHVFAGLEVFLAHYVIICDHVFAGLEVFLGGRGRQCYCYLQRMFSKDSERRKKASRFNTTSLIYRLKGRHRSCIKGLSAASTVNGNITTSYCAFTTLAGTSWRSVTVYYGEQLRYNVTAYVVKMLHFMYQYTILPLVFHLICVDYFKLKLILTIVCTKICLLLETAPRVALRLKICEENNVIIA